jgi:hypothetical protein
MLLESDAQLARCAVLKFGLEHGPLDKGALAMKVFWRIANFQAIRLGSARAVLRAV